MKNESVIIIAVVAAVIGGVVGGMIARPADTGPVTSYDNLTVKNLKVEKCDFKELISWEKNKITTRIINGNIETSQMVKAATVASGFKVMTPQIVTREVQIATNPLAANVKELKVYGQIAATKAGGGISMRNAKGALLPQGDAPKDGTMLYMGFDSNEAPILYTTEIGKAKPKKVIIYHPAVLAANQVKETAKKRRR